MREYARDAVASNRATGTYSGMSSAEPLALTRIDTPLGEMVAAASETHLATGSRSSSPAIA